MSDVFISYARADRALAEPICARLQALGLKVFFDIDGGIDAGDAFPIRIGDAVEKAKAVLALWSPHALTRDWCRKECHLAQSLGKLVAAIIIPTTTADLREFAATSYENLIDLNEATLHFGWSQVLFAIARRLDVWAAAQIESQEEAVATVQRASVVRQAAIAARPKAGAPSVLGQSGAAAIWEKVNKDDPVDLLNFAETFPGSAEAMEARRRASELQVSAKGIDSPFAHERWAWARIEAGLVADMALYPGAGLEIGDHQSWVAGKQGAVPDPRDRDSYSPDHTLSERFLRRVLFSERLASALDRPGVRVRHARIAEPVHWAGRTTAGELWFDSCLFEAEVFWREFQVNGLLSLDGTRLMETLAADGLQVRGSLLCNDGFVAEKDLRLLGAKIGGSAAFRGARLHGALMADGMQVEESVFLSDGFAGADVRLVKAEVGGDLVCAGADYIHALVGFGLKLGGDTFLRSVRSLGGVQLARARIAGDLQLSSSNIDGEIDLTGAEVAGELQLSQGSGLNPTWSEKARLTLRRTQVGALAGGVDAFRCRRGGRSSLRREDFVPMDLRGFRYAMLGGLRVEDSLAAAPARQLKSWLEAGTPRDQFDAGPYRQLAQALSGAGNYGLARAIRRAMEQHELKSTKGMRRIQLQLARVLFGYGDSASRPIVWFLSIVLAGVLIGGYLEALPFLDVSGAEHRWARWLLFSLGNSLPLELDESNQTFLARTFSVEGAEEAPVGVAAIFYLHKLLGFVALAYLVLSLARKRRE